MVPWHVRAQDLVWRLALRVSFLIFEFYCYLFRPTVKGVYVAVWCDEDLLLVENSYRPKFYFPSGGVKAYEEPLTAARRELLEEVGLEIPIDRFTNELAIEVHHNFMQDKVSIFEVHLDSEPQLFIDRREVVAAQFFPIRDVLELNLATVVREYLTRNDIGAQGSH